MANLSYAHLYAAGGFSGDSFDIAQGPANTGIIDVLLSAGTASNLTDNAPHVLVSTGALGAANALSIAGMEVESVAEGSQPLRGRFFYLSVQNTDIMANNITVTSSATINGASSLVIANTGDYLFHHVALGVWRVNVLPMPSQPFATLTRVPFTSSDWSNNSLEILQTGTPGAGQAGPHLLAAHTSYLVQIVNTDLTPNEIVNIETQFDSSGDITLLKAPRAADFNGVAIIAGTVD